ncbi:hypothetical protein QT231_23755 [Halomonas sp. SpR1]|uniref:hypothetical protein n=1 Tax=Halomonas sp. SpR1 TaxID=3050462 RepID=UPI0027E3D57C|nr:hypothetical protein [Halomonas sp. SpR1]MDQ7735718.1 hypothetical protein [Halomonas sp. SpR1]
MGHAIEFIETPTFTRQIQSIVTDDELKELQRTLIAQPTKGDLIKGIAGLRKIRMALGLQGKSSGARVIYFLATVEKNLPDTGLPQEHEGQLNAC